MGQGGHQEGGEGERCLQVGVAAGARPGEPGETAACLWRWRWIRYVYLYVCIINYTYTCIYIVHVLMRDKRRKEERSKQGQANNKANNTQHTQGSHFS